MLFGTPVEGLDLGATYPLKMPQPISEGMEYTAQVLDDKSAVGYGDKEGTATYMTYGVSHSVSDNLLTYAEYQQTDNDTGIDTDPNGSWFEIPFNLKQGGSAMCVPSIFLANYYYDSPTFNLEPAWVVHFFRLRTLFWRYGYSKDLHQTVIGTSFIFHH